MRRSNPTSVELVRIRNSQRLTDDIERLVRQVADADEAREEWGTNQRKFTKQRYGIRKRFASAPWKGASNLHIPLIDKAVRRWKPAIVRLVTESVPIAFFHGREAGDVESSQLAQNFYDWLFRWEMDALDEVVFAADILAHRGLVFVECGWDYRTERRARIVDMSDLFPEGPPPETNEEGQQTGEPDRFAIGQALMMEYGLDPLFPDDAAVLEAAVETYLAGQTRFKIVYRDVVRDRPKVESLDPIQVVVPSRCTDIGQAPFICIQNVFSLQDLMRMARDNVLEPNAVAEVRQIVEERLSKDSDVTSAFDVFSPGQIKDEDRQAVDKLVGIIESYETPEQLEVWKLYTWLDINGDDEEERVVLWYHPSTKTILSLQEYVLPFNRWPVVHIDFEKTHSKRVFSSRGIPQLLTALQIEVNKLHNSRLNAIAIQLAPVFVVKGRQNWQRQFRWAPGAAVPAGNTEDIKPLIQDHRNLMEYTREEQHTRLIAEEYIGIYDASLGSPGSPNDVRTATEIEAIQAQVSNVFSLDAQLWQKGWRDIHGLTFGLWQELGPKEVWIRVTGEPQPQRVLKRDIAHNYDIEPAGTPTNTNKAMELARAREALSLCWNPFTASTGLINAQQLLDWYFSAHDPRRAKRIVNDPQAAAEQQTILQAAAAIQQGQGGELFNTANQVVGQKAGRNSR